MRQGKNDSYVYCTRISLCFEERAAYFCLGESSLTKMFSRRTLRAAALAGQDLVRLRKIHGLAFQLRNEKQLREHFRACLDWRCRWIFPRRGEPPASCSPWRPKLASAWPPKFTFTSPLPDKHEFPKILTEPS